MKSKLLAIVLSFAMAISVLPTIALAGYFSDMPNDYSTSSLEAAVENGLLSGADGKIMPQAELTRAQMAAMLVRAFGEDGSADLSGYTDVDFSSWYADELAEAVQMGAFYGDGDTIRPDDAITRQEAFVVLSRVFKLSEGDDSTLDAFADGDDVASWATSGVAAMVEAGYVSGDGTSINPTGNISRQDFAVTMNRLVKEYISEAGTYTEVADGNVMINTPDVTLSDLTITGDLIIGDGVGDGDISLNNVTVEGQMVVRGGGVNSIVITGESNIGSIIISKVNGFVRVSVEGDASVQAVYINDGKDDVIVEGTISSLEIISDVPVIIQNAVIENISVSAADATVTLGENAVVTEINIDGGDTSLTVGEGAVVETITATENATDAAIEVQDGASVTTVEVGAEGVALSGDGSVDSVAVSADNVSVDTSGTEVSVGDGVSGTTASGSDVDAGSSTTTDSSSSSSSSGGSSSSGSSSSGSSSSGGSSGDDTTTTDLNISVDYDTKQLTWDFDTTYSSAYKVSFVGTTGTESTKTSYAPLSIYDLSADTYSQIIIQELDTDWSTVLSTSTLDVSIVVSEVDYTNQSLTIDFDFDTNTVTIYGLEYENSDTVDTGIYLDTENSGYHKVSNNSFVDGSYSDTFSAFDDYDTYSIYQFDVSNTTTAFSYVRYVYAENVAIGSDPDTGDDGDDGDVSYTDYSDTIKDANLVDHAAIPQESLYDSYSVDAELGDDGIHEVYIDADDLVKYTNADNNVGYWTGFAILAPDGATQMNYKFASENDWSAAMNLEEDVDGKGNDGLAIYFDASSTNPCDYVAVQWLDANEEVLYSVETTVDITGVYLADLYQVQFKDGTTHLCK